MLSDEPLECGACGRHVKDEDEFCVSCGALFIEDVFCVNHPENPAEGVCPICQHPYCNECASSVKGTFLCLNDEGFEVIEAMAKVFGSSDPLEISEAELIIKTAGLHPFIYSGKSNPLFLGSADYTLFRAAGDYGGNIVNEFKVMVPLAEALDALGALRQSDNFADSENAEEE